MDDGTLLSRLAVSLAIGLLVGLERGWRTRDEEDHQRAAGLRTFAISGLLGGIAGAIGQSLGGLVTGLIFLGYAFSFTAFHWLEAKAEHDLSATSVIAGLATFALGAFAVVGHLTAAIASAVALTTLLALRDQLHRWVASLSWPEIRAALVLLAMSFLLLPILPNHAIDPWQAINPYVIWLFAVLVAAVSFGGYLAIKIFGDRLGVVMAAVAGGLASSTATTLTLAKMAREHPGSSSLFAGGVLIAGLVMFLRVGVIATALNPILAWSLIPPLLAAGTIMATGSAIALLMSGRQSKQPALHIANPLELGSALKMAGLIAGVMLAARLLQQHFGDAGVLATAGLSGIVDVDAIVLSMARMASESIDVALAAKAILLATAVNTLVKAALALYTGAFQLSIHVGFVSILAIVAGGAALYWSTPHL